MPSSGYKSSYKGFRWPGPVWYVPARVADGARSR
jgi:hypothetical protein